MKLIYMWVKNHRNFINEQGFSFSSEYKVDYKDRLFIEKNKDFIEDFYGENVLDITAIVGENGAGKTTLAKMVYNYCKSVHLVRRDNYGNDFSKHIQVYADTYIDRGKEKEKIVIYYFLGNEVLLDVDCPGIEYDKPICLYGLKNNDNGNNSYDEACEEHKMTTLYFSNTFDISHTARNSGFAESTLFQVNKSLCFSPMYDLQKSVVETKKSYGGVVFTENNIALMDAKNGYVEELNPLDPTQTDGKLNVIRNYAEKMSSHYYISYRNYLSKNILLTFENAPYSIKHKLPIFRELNTFTVEFGDYLHFEEKMNELNEFDRTVYFIRKNIYEKIVESMSSQTIFEYIYINVLCEIVLYLNIFNCDYKNVDFEKIGKTFNNIDSDEAFEIIINSLPEMNSQDKLKSVQLIKRIRDISFLDISVIKEFLDLKDHRSHIILKQTNWYTQIEDYFLKFNQVSRLDINKNITFQDTDVIDFLLEEFKKENSIYRRMINIEPPTSSTGEMSLLNIFASLYQTMSLKKTSNNILLIIDEIDAYLHPRWQQEIVSDITSWINESKYFKDKKVQLIITSHSPIVLSDITSDRVIKLKKDENEKCIVQNCETPTFGANIATLFYDSFFMEEGSIGQVAKNKIQKVIEYNKGNNHLNESEIEYIIDSIGEPIVQRKLKNDFYRVKDKYNKQDELDKLLNTIGYENAIETLKKFVQKGESDDKN